MRDVGGPMLLPDYPGDPQRRKGRFARSVFPLTSFGITAIIHEKLKFLYFCWLLCSGSQPAPITSVDVFVPRSLVPSIYGEDGGCLKRIREVCLIIMLLHIKLICSP